MTRCSGKLGKLLSPFLAHAHPGRAAGGDKAREPVILALASHQHVIETASAGFERFLHRMHAEENVHKE